MFVLWWKLKGHVVLKAWAKILSCKLFSLHITLAAWYKAFAYVQEITPRRTLLELCVIMESSRMPLPGSWISAQYFLNLNLKLQLYQIPVVLNLPLQEKWLTQFSSLNIFLDTATMIYPLLPSPLKFLAERVEPGPLSPLSPTVSLVSVLPPYAQLNHQLHSRNHKHRKYSSIMLRIAIFCSHFCSFYLKKIKN